MSKVNRRRFVGTAVAAGGALAMGMRHGQGADAPANAPDAAVPNTAVVPKKPTDQVLLGKSGIKISVVGVGTGTIGVGHHSNQTKLGQDEFTRLMRHALDNGITFFDCADQYGSNPYLGRAMQGVPRDRYVIQTKCISRDPQRARDDIDRFLKELQTDYIDSLIMHVVTEPDWTTKFQGAMEVFEEAKQQGKVRAHGVTCHSFPALQAAYASDWVQINQVRWNPKRSHMDANVEQAKALFQQMRDKGQGMIGMKVFGEGSLAKPDAGVTPEELYRFQVESGVVDAFVVGVEKQEHIDQMLHGTQLALNEVGYRLASWAATRTRVG